MDPLVLEPRVEIGDSVALVSYTPIPGLGLLSINAYLIRAEQPTLVDTGTAEISDTFMENLRAAIRVEDLRWLWLTHTDPDHTGSLLKILNLAPHLRVVTNFVGMAKMDLLGLPIDRCYLVNPGQTLHVGDRDLLAVKPATFDAPETTAVFDTKTAVFYSADSFGALVQEPVQDAQQIDPQALRSGMLTWVGVDVPWVHLVDENKFARVVDNIRGLRARAIMSSHLAPAVGMTDALLQNLAALPSAPPFVGPDQQALEALMAGLAAAPR